jgi:glycosyltransferase involved in cell wall biosynthesis
VPSAFVRNAVASATRRQAQVMPGAAGLSFRPFLGRRHFGLPESSFVFLVTFDLRSSVERYNPMAAVEAFVRLCQSRPSLDTALVVKMSGATDRPAAAVAFREALAPRTSAAGLRRVILLERELTGNETKNLVRCSDAVVSLHRSEGSGRWLADAMLLGKPVVATNYSGNVDFMTPDVACLVGYDLIPVQPEAHPFWQGQVWADPDVEEAAHWMRKITDDSRWRRVLGDRASRHVRKTLSHRAIGLRLADQLAPLAKTRTADEEPGSVRGGGESGGEA